MKCLQPNIKIAGYAFDPVAFQTEGERWTTIIHDQADIEAEKRIAEVLQSRVEYLNLWKLGLIELPESLGRLTWLQSLNLSNNRLRTLSESFGKLNCVIHRHRFNSKLVE